MPLPDLDLTPFHIEEHDTVELVEKLNSAMDATADQVNLGLKAVGENAENIATLASIAEDVTAVASISPAVETVAAGSADVEIVAGGMTAVQASAANMPAILVAPTAANSAGLSAVQAAASAAAAATITGLNDVLQFTSQKALANAIHMTAGTSGGAIRALNNVNNNFGTGDFTLVWRGSFPNWAPSAIHNLYYKYQSSGQRVRWYISNGTVGFLVVLGNVTAINITSTATLGSIGLLPWQICEFALSVRRETPASAGQILITVNGVQLGEPIGIAALTPVNIDALSTLQISSANTDASGRVESVTHAAYIYNRALTVAQLLDNAINGINAVDIGASNVPFYRGDFSAGPGAVQATNATATGNHDGVSDGVTSKDNCLWVTLDSGGGRIRTVPNFVFTVGRWARVKISYYIPSGQPITNIQILSNGSKVIVSPSPVVGQWVDFEFNYLPLADTERELRIYGVGVAAGDQFYVAVLDINTLGVIARYEPEDIQSGGQWLDSANGNHALVPASGATVMRPPRVNQQRGTNTWAATSETQYVGGFNQAVFPANSAITTLDIHSTGAVSVNVGDGADVDRYGAALALAAGRNRVALLTPFNDGANLKLTLTPTASFTGTLKTTCDYKLQEA